jgi:RimJ/RimL family protein N-acetyltransferase
MVGFFNTFKTKSQIETWLQYGRVSLRPLVELDQKAWKRVQAHFRDSEISYLNGTPPNRMPLWFLKRLLKADSRRPDRSTYGVYDQWNEYIGTIELYDIRFDHATLGIIIGEKTHWNEGYGPEAIKALLGYAFGKLHLDKVRLSTFADNPRAQTAFKKVGFVEVKRVQTGNSRVDVHMSISKATWLEQQLLNGSSNSVREFFF